MKKLLLIAGIAVISSCSSKKAAETVAGDDIPDCIKKLVTQFQEEDKQNPPRSIYRYMYNGNLVYYVPPVCCDQFSDLYNTKCELIGHPDGGFTGRGDGKHPDFMNIRSEEKLIWKDERK
ncbi:MAG TPA: hypothetical protein VK484_05795 [Ferruginibacter sp.]|nr:hypothetical protein [Ferruginibacter sp.]